MNPFEEFDEFLGEEISAGYWSEMGVDSAATIIGEFSPSDWAALKACLRERSTEWVLRCIEVLEYGQVDESVPLLLELLLNEDDDLAQMAADTLDTHRLRSVSIEANSAVKSRLEDLIKQRPQLDAETDQALLDRIHFS